MSVIRGTVAPLVVFIPLATAAGYFIFGHFVASGVQANTTLRCSPATPEEFTYRLPYTPWSIPNEALCGAVATFHAAMATTEGLVFLKSFAAWAAPVAYFILVEACRPGQSKFLVPSLLIGLLYQVASGGIIMTLYWLVFILVGAHRLNKDSTQRLGYVKQGTAEALAFGFLVGAVVPTFGLLLLEDPYVTAMWQPFTVFVSIAFHIHHFLRPSSPTQPSGFTILQAGYIGMFILCSSYHASTVWPMFLDVQALGATFVPSLSPIPSHPLDPVAAAHHLLQYDAVFSVGPTILATMWFSFNLKQTMGLLAWYAVATPIAGPGAAIAAVMLWRESMLSEGAIATDSKRTS